MSATHWVISSNQPALSGYAKYLDSCGTSRATCLYSVNQSLNMEALDTFRGRLARSARVQLVVVAVGSSYEVWFDKSHNPCTASLCQVLRKAGVSFGVVVCPTTHEERRKFSENREQARRDVLGAFRAADPSHASVSLEDIEVWLGFSKDEPYVALDVDLRGGDGGGDGAGVVPPAQLCSARSRRWAAWACVLGAVLALGIVLDYIRLKKENSTLNQENSSLTQEISTLRQQRADLKQNIADLKQNMAGLMGQYADLLQKMGNLTWLKSQLALYMRPHMKLFGGSSETNCSAGHD